MKLVLKLIRAVLGAAILFLDRLFRPRPLERAPELQKKIDAETAKLSIYQFVSCPFCVKVRRAARRLGLNIRYRDVNTDPAAEKELLAGGGEYQVPCLRIEKEDGSVQWMYESSDIIRYLETRFS